MTRLFIVFLCLMVALKADVKSPTGQIRFDAQSDNQTEMLLNGTGLGIGVAPSTNLHVNGNAIVSGRIFAGGSSGSSNLNVNGTHGFGYQTVSSNATLGASSLVLVDSSSDNISITLPYAANVTGRLYQIKKISTFNSVWINGGGNLIDDTNVIELPDSSDLGSVKLMSNGSQWYKMGQKNLSETIASSNLVGWWKFDETSGNTAVDSSGQSNNGTMSSFSFSTNTIQTSLNNALVFDGIDDHIVIENDSSLELTNDFSICFWYYVSQWPGTTSILSKRNTVAGMDWEIFYHGTANEIRFVYGNSLAVTIFDLLNVDPSLDNWHHIVMTRQGDVFTLYLNGLSQGTETNALAMPTGDNIMIGRIGADSGLYFKGNIDDVRFYNRSLTDSEIKAINIQGL